MNLWNSTDTDWDRATAALAVKVAFVIDEDDMASNLANRVPSQQSVKAYVDNNGGGGAVEVGSLLAGIDSRTAYAAEFGADEGYDEEFDGANIDDDDLPTDWVDLSMEAAAVYRQYLGAGRIDYGGGGDSSNIQAVGRPLPATTTFDAITHLKMAHDDDNTYLGGMVLHNSANGDFVWFGVHQPTTPAVPQLYVVHYTDADTASTTLAGPITIWPSQINDGYFRIIKGSDSSYTCMFSPDGACFFTILGGANLNSTLGADPTHIGFGLNTTGASHVACEWLRVRNVT